MYNIISITIYCLYIHTIYYVHQITSYEDGSELGPTVFDFKVDLIYGCLSLKPWHLFLVIPSLFFRTCVHFSRPTW